VSTMDRFVRWLTGDEEGETNGRPAPAPPQNGDSHRQLTPLGGLPPLESNADDYGVTVEEASVEPGVEYWRAVRIYHLGPHENRGRHHIFIDAISPLGDRVHNSRATITWDGGEQTVSLDKPEDEPGANFPMWKWQECSVSMLGLPSDVIHGLRTNHPDEPLPDGSQSGNTLFHHSFLVIFQKVTVPESAGVIRGKVVNYRPGLMVALLHDQNVVERAAVAEDGSFIFSPPPGDYEVELEDQQQMVTVASDQEVAVEFTLIPHDSVVEGVIHDAHGLLLRLVHEGEALAEGKLGQSGSFRLRNLKAGTYFIQILQPGTIEPVLQSGALELNGTNHLRIELSVPVSSEPPTCSDIEQDTEPSTSQDVSTDSEPHDKAILKRYVLFGAPDRSQTRTILTVLVPVLAEKRLTFGFEISEAAHAREVTIIGDEDTVPQSTLLYLTMRGVKVQRITGTPEEIGAQLSE
jgi:hypothetical protein